MISGELKSQLITISSTIHEPPKIGEADGVAASPLYQKLPAEVRRSIYLYLVKVDGTINAILQHRYLVSGFQFCLCDRVCLAESFDVSECPSPCLRFQNNVFLISRTVRRDCLDLFFSCNRFVYTSLSDLSNFTSRFQKSSSCIQNIHLDLSLCDTSCEYESVSAASARQRLSTLRRISLNVTIYPTCALERLNESDLVMSLCSFALGDVEEGSMWENMNSSVLLTKLSPVTPLVGFECVVNFAGSRWDTDYTSRMCHRIETYLREVFTQAGKSYRRLSQVPKLISLNPWTERARSPSPKGKERQGMLFMND